MHHRRKTHKRGGFLGEIINQAIVPFGIFGLQQTYKKKGGKSKRRSRSRSGGKRSRRH